MSASLAGLERGEVVCVPGLEDPELVAALERARLAVFRAGNRRELARRYAGLPDADAANTN
jgi:hypothetical protein